MSICLSLHYTVDKELQSQPEERENSLSYEDDQYTFDIGCGMSLPPLGELLTIKEHLQKGLEPELLAKVKFISRTEGKHDPKIMLALAVAIKDKLDQKGDNFITEIGLEPDWRTVKTRDKLQSQLEDFITFCEFGIKNKLKQFNHIYQ
jgi:hypothetical protein